MDLAQLIMLVLGTEIPAGTPAQVLGCTSFTPDADIAQIQIGDQKFNLYLDKTKKTISVHPDDPNDPAF